MSKSWHDGWQSCERAQHGQGAWQLWRTETRPAWLKGTEWGAEWCELGLEKQERRANGHTWLSYKGPHCSPPSSPYRNICLNTWGLRWTWGYRDSRKTFMFSKTRIAAGSKKATVFCVSWSDTGNNRKIIIICISNLFCSSYRHDFTKKM